MRVKLLIALILCSTTLCASEQRGTNHYPEFSWDTVPVALHFSKKRTNYTKDEINFISRFPLFCVEKHQAYGKYQDVREGTMEAGEAIKRINPKAKVLFYWNSNIDMGANYFGENILDKKHPEWGMKDLKGRDVLIRGAEKTYDIRNTEFRSWWQDIPSKVVKQSKGVDGVYVDAIAHYLREREVTDKRCGEGTMDKMREGVNALIGGLRKKLGDKSLIIANNIHPEADFNTDIVQYVDGGMIEHYCFGDTATPETMLAQIKTVQRAAANDKIVMVKCWPRYYFRRSEEYRDIPRETMYEHMKEDITFPLACFLVGAGKYSYFLYSWGYHEYMGGLVDFPEYHKPLGEPLELAQEDGYKLTRRFKHAYVEVDLETRTAKIDWK